MRGMSVWYPRGTERTRQPITGRR
uniref:Uncharacterized protein n=1 Tax=Neospora caninum (strain Liverpool) TaxID=572307 RepID=F0JAU4_NEOCL|nr:hypothetical protein NCLIV_068750 [Neospora caninum Liverpool]CEL71211.1 TPA: hypothetical protein BN1204_068750 [Neospora caninum Liverpool]